MLRCRQHRRQRLLLALAVVSTRACGGVGNIRGLSLPICSVVNNTEQSRWPVLVPHSRVPVKSPVHLQLSCISNEPRSGGERPADLGDVLSAWSYATSIGALSSCDATYL